MRIRMVVALCAVLALAAGVATARAGNGGNSADAKKCQKGGWKSLVRSDRTPFANEGDCVSYAAKGGTLVGLPDLILDVTCTPATPATFNGSASCTFKVKNIGGSPVSGTIKLQATVDIFTSLASLPIGTFLTQFVSSSDCGSGSAASTPSPSVDSTRFTGSAVLSCVVNAPLAPGSTSTFNLGVSGGRADTSGFTTTITATVDPDNTIAESNETNNTSSQTYTN